MAKKHVSVSLRKPPPPADLEKSIVEAVTAPTSDVRELAPPSSSVDAFVAPKSKPGFCTITIDLPEKIADQLAAFCAENGRDVHEVVAEILAKHFAAAENPTPAPTTTPTTDATSPTTMDALVAWLRDRIRVAGAMRARLARLGQMAWASL